MDPLNTEWDPLNTEWGPLYTEWDPLNTDTQTELSLNFDMQHLDVISFDISTWPHSEGPV